MFSVPLCFKILGSSLQLLKKLATGAGNKDPARNVALAVLHALHNARRLAALGAIRALGGVHHFLAICCFGYLGHGTDILLSG